MNAWLEQITATIEQMEYDFSHFAIEDFAEWVAKRRGKPIVLQPWEVMPRGVFGLWLSAKESESIYYYDKMPPILELMTLLHELSHIYLNHKTLIVTNALESLVALLLNNEERQVQALSRAIFDRDSREEQEAETMALLLLQRVLRLGRSNTGSDSPGADYLKALKVW